MKKVYGLIRRLGANSKYKGYFFVAEAVKISMGYQYKPLRITKDIYPCLARKYRSTPTNIEHDIRTMVNVCWEGNKKLLDEIAGYPLEYKPTNSLRKESKVVQTKKQYGDFSLTALSFASISIFSG